MQSAAAAPSSMQSNGAPQGPLCFLPLLPSFAGKQTTLTGAAPTEHSSTTSPRQGLLLGADGWEMAPRGCSWRCWLRAQLCAAQHSAPGLLHSSV